MQNELPTSIVIFGASGDLTQRKLVPALYNQRIKGRIQDAVNIVGSARTPFSHAEFRNRHPNIEIIATISRISSSLKCFRSSVKC